MCVLPSVLWHCWLGGKKGIRPVKKMGDGGGGHWLVRMEWHPAGWSVYVPLLIFPCTIKSRSSLLAPAHPGGPRKRAVKRLRRRNVSMKATAHLYVTSVTVLRRLHWTASLCRCYIICACAEWQKNDFSWRASVYINPHKYSSGFRSKRKGMKQNTCWRCFMTVDGVLVGLKKTTVAMLGSGLSRTWEQRSVMLRTSRALCSSVALAHHNFIVM